MTTRADVTSTATPSVTPRETPAETPVEVVRVRGCLDAAARARLAGACAEASRTGHGLAVDLRSVTSFTEAGVAGIAECWRAARRMPGGVRVEVSTPQGRTAMLMSMERAAGGSAPGGDGVDQRRDPPAPSDEL